MGAALAAPFVDVVKRYYAPGNGSVLRAPVPILELLLPECSLGDYRKLEVWRRARAFSYEIVRLVERLPLRHRIRIGSQLSRAAESIRFNVVEGCGLNTDPLLANHVRRALGSANEVEDQLDSLRMLGRLRADEFWLTDEIGEIRSMLAGFLRRLEADIARQRNTRRRNAP